MIQQIIELKMRVQIRMRTKDSNVRTNYGNNIHVIEYNTWWKNDKHNFDKKKLGGNIDVKEDYVFNNQFIAKNK